MEGRWEGQRFKKNKQGAHGGKVIVFQLTDLLLMEEQSVHPVWWGHLGEER